MEKNKNNNDRTRVGRSPENVTSIPSEFVAFRGFYNMWRVRIPLRETINFINIKNIMVRVLRMYVRARLRVVTNKNSRFWPRKLYFPSRVKIFSEISAKTVDYFSALRLHSSCR